MNVAKSAGAAVLLVSGVAALAYFGTRSSKKPTLLPQPELKTSTAVVKAEQTIGCRIVAQQMVWASTPMLGPIEAVYAEVGQTVSDGQILARVQSGMVTPTVAVMEQDASRDHTREVTARLTSARAEAKKLQADVLRARTTLARLEPAFRKQELLNNAGATPRLVYENARAEHQHAIQDLAAAEEASRQADNVASRVTDELGQAEETAKEKGKAAVAVASGIATAEIHAPSSGLVIERKVAMGDAVTEVNRGELFRIAIHPELLRAEFDAGSGLATGQAVSLHAGGSEIRVVVNEAGSADFESHLGAVTIGTPCSAGVRIK